MQRSRRTDTLQTPQITGLQSFNILQQLQTSEWWPNQHKPFCCLEIKKQSQQWSIVG